MLLLYYEGHVCFYAYVFVHYVFWIKFINYKLVYFMTIRTTSTFVSDIALGFWVSGAVIIIFFQFVILMLLFCCFLVSACPSGDFISLFSVSACPSGTFGPACRGVCRCGKNTLCDSVTGECRCKSGHQGRHCTKGKNKRFSTALCFQ